MFQIQSGVCLSVPSEYSSSLTRGQHVTWPVDSDGDRHTGDWSEIAEKLLRGGAGLGRWTGN